jgi:hypothetical protein
VSGKKFIEIAMNQKRLDIYAANAFEILRQSLADVAEKWMSAEVCSFQVAIVL